ncbi:glycosyltransferase family 39 protein [Arthrobacter sp. 260]|uniref:glycosyltransferase family 39 protein n=1 Tax=Arthrobacter sp. 260 TaxID=2735314 RepID=UPI001491CF19|nr:glycosyltransferase family 39 protein [Arthrobacter sp. 260]NOJ60576.1 hypothetical protein [Arthrobacter sp. 260]
MDDTRPGRHRLALGPVWSAAAALAVALTLFSAPYGFHRDELYFRMLEPAWGYVDQPPLTPLLVQFFSSVVADEPWAIRIPATVAASASVLVIAGITRELGGDRAAQTLSAWAYAFAATPLLMGHVMLTSSLDLLVWPAVCLLVIMAVLRDEKRWWLLTGVVVGLSMYNKLLVAGLLASLVVGLLLVGPRGVLVSRAVIAAAVIALAIGAPNLIYQAANGWPQLAMGAALAGNNAGEVRILMWPFLLLLLGPPLVLVWVAGVVALVRRPQWRAVRFLAAALPVLLVLTFLAGSQVYYPFGLLAVLFAAGCIPVVEYVDRSGRKLRPALAGAVALNAVVSAVIALPLLPVRTLGASPIPALNQLAADQVGWPEYTQQVASAYLSLPAGERERAVIIASNYGEAGAVARYGLDLGLPGPYSGHNQLYFDRIPPEIADTAVIVGGQVERVSAYFASCEHVGSLDHGLGVDSEEQAQPLALCRSPLGSWAAIWPVFQHYD